MNAALHVSAAVVSGLIFGAAGCASEPNVPPPPTTTPTATTMPSNEVTTLRGFLASGYFAVGGETTGWMLRRSEDQRANPLEVDPTPVMETAREFDFSNVIATGHYVTRTGPERGDRQVFLITDLQPAE